MIQHTMVIKVDNKPFNLAITVEKRIHRALLNIHNGEHRKVKQ
ncbi:hypothetical protein [Sphingobacterium haloxyli]|nr:hypothetical protein [Sphingobacterium haloxyli]